MSNRYKNIALFIGYLFVFFSCESEFEVSTEGGAFDGYTVLAPMNDEEVIVIDNAGDVLESVKTGLRPGVDVQLIPNGKILGVFKVSKPSIDFGGYGGIVRIFDFQGNVEWQYTISSDDEMVHHDAEYLPNGNVLLTIWERKSREEANQRGLSIEEDVYVDYIIEIDPAQ